MAWKGACEHDRRGALEADDVRAQHGVALLFAHRDVARRRAADYNVADYADERDDALFEERELREVGRAQDGVAAREGVVGHAALGQLAEAFLTQIQLVVAVR